MASVSRDFVLVSDGVHLLVGIVHENVFRAFLDAFHGAFGRAFMRSLRAALAICDVAGPASVTCECECADEKGNNYNRAKPDFHAMPPCDYTDRPRQRRTAAR